MLVTITEAGKALRVEAEPAVIQAQEDILAPLNEGGTRAGLRPLQRLADENNALSRVPIRRAG
ncbi:hypothetical protein HSBAA_48500 [Vreelandella sulfidaeris]|uniref:Uncharacterized protein n=1 Tax=Vreelandella sulfidaeris TaxID=115553 RepID=A0A455UKS5_9GAMM|nr:hypothetical protein HSBAA_48500 [Halomonas sulfidaeris]